MDEVSLGVVRRLEDERELLIGAQPGEALALRLRPVLVVEGRRVGGRDHRRGEREPVARQHAGALLDLARVADLRSAPGTADDRLPGVAAVPPAEVGERLHLEHLLVERARRRRAVVPPQARHRAEVGRGDDRPHHGAPIHRLHAVLDAHPVLLGGGRPLRGARRAVDPAKLVGRTVGGVPAVALGHRERLGTRVELVVGDLPEPERRQVRAQPHDRAEPHHRPEPRPLLVERVRRPRPVHEQLAEHVLRPGADGERHELHPRRLAPRGQLEQRLDPRSPTQEAVVGVRRVVLGHEAVVRPGPRGARRLAVAVDHLPRRERAQLALELLGGGVDVGDGPPRYGARGRRGPRRREGLRGRRRRRDEPGHGRRDDARRHRGGEQRHGLSGGACP